MEKNENLKTTKKDSYSHGRGILSVQRVAEKYTELLDLLIKERFLRLRLYFIG